MNKKCLNFIIFAAVAIILAAIAAAVIIPDKTDSAVPAVYIVYGSEKGDLSYTDAAYRGLMAAQNDSDFNIKEFVPDDYETLPGILERTNASEKPCLVITVGFQYANFTQQLAEQYPDIQFLAIDQTGIGSKNLKAYEIVSYGDSYLAGVLAASASKTDNVGIILGMKTDLLDVFLKGYTNGVLAVNSSVSVSHAYVRQNSTDGFSDPDEAEKIAEGMYLNGTDVIYTCAGYSNMGAFDAAKKEAGRYVIGTDSDQTMFGPDVVLASALKRVDIVVYNEIKEHLNGSFTGGEEVAGLKDGATGIVYNPKFEFYNETVSIREDKAKAEEDKFLLLRSSSVEK